MQLPSFLLFIYSVRVCVCVCVCVCVTLYHANNVTIEKRNTLLFFKVSLQNCKKLCHIRLSVFLFCPSVRTEQVSSQWTDFGQF